MLISYLPRGKLSPTEKSIYFKSEDSNTDMLVLGSEFMTTEPTSPQRRKWWVYLPGLMPMAACPRTELRFTPRKVMVAIRPPLLRQHKGPLWRVGPGAPLLACSWSKNAGGQQCFWPAVEPELSGMVWHSFFKHITLGWDARFVDWCGTEPWSWSPSATGDLLSWTVRLYKCIDYPPPRPWFCTLDEPCFRRS